MWQPWNGLAGQTPGGPATYWLTSLAEVSEPVQPIDDTKWGTP